jgi:hypothetical protein
MTRIARPLQALLLAFVLVLTAQTMAVARGQAVAAGEMVICSAAGLVTVQVDAEGNPVGPPHLCPDCVVSLSAWDVPAAVVVPGDRVLSEMVFPWEAAAACPGRAPGLPSARGPPAGV